MEKIVQMVLAVVAMLAGQLKKVDAVLGIKETKEALVGVNEIALHIAQKLADGAQLADFAALYADIQNDPEFKAKLQVAWENHKAIPAEVKDIDVGEGLELAAVQIEYAPKIVSAITKKS